MIVHRSHSIGIDLNPGVDTNEMLQNNDFDLLDLDHCRRSMLSATMETKVYVDLHRRVLDLKLHSVLLRTLPSQKDNPRSRRHQKIRCELYQDRLKLQVDGDSRPDGFLCHGLLDLD